MMRYFVVLAFAALMMIEPATAAEVGSKAEAVAMVKRVQDMFKKDGPQATFKAVSDKSTTEFHDRDLYPFIYDLKGVCVAHGARPALIGKNLVDLKDQDGKYLIQEMIKIALRSQAPVGSTTNGPIRLPTRLKTSRATSKKWEITSWVSEILINNNCISQVMRGERNETNEATGTRRVFALFENLPIQIKAFSASAILLICLIFLGAVAYVTLDRSQEGLHTL